VAARRELLVDAYNVMFAHPQIGPLLRRDAKRARDEFLDVVRSCRPSDSSRVYVVFDAHRVPGAATEAGEKGRGYEGGIHLVYARETADVWIQKRIRAHSDPGQLTIVTSDREILATVEAHGAQVLTVRRFLGLPARRRARASKARSREKPEHVSRREVEEMERLFRERQDEE
jgi:predicted RNA-binding protein with PIN domain